MVFFSFLNFFCYLFSNSLVRVRSELIVMTFFIFSLFGLAELVLARREALMVFYNFLVVFAIFLKFSISGWVGIDRNDNFYFLFHSLSQSVLAWRDALMVFFNFLNFFAIFSEFPISGIGGTDRNDNFYFLFFSSFPILVRLEKKP